MPKFKQVATILDQLEYRFISSSEFSKAYEPISIKRLKQTKTKTPDDKSSLDSKSQQRRSINKNVLVITRNFKQYTDLMKFLHQFYVRKDSGQGFYDERLRMHLNSLKESNRRLQAFDIGNKPKNIKLGPELMEVFFLQKLAILLDQKYGFHHPTSEARPADSKKRTRD